MLMTLLVILVCIAVQRFLTLPLQKPSLPIGKILFRRLDQWLKLTLWWQGYRGLLLFYAALGVMYWAVIFSLSHFLGWIFTLCVNLCVLWYYLDAKSLTVPEGEAIDLSAMLIIRYHTFFAVLFWYIIAGPFGAIVYGETYRLSRDLQSQQEADVYFSNEFLRGLHKTLGYLDWAPTRLVGLTYALVGQFRPAFHYWYGRLRAVDTSAFLVVDYGLIALHGNTQRILTGSVEQMAEVEGLTNRAVAVWIAILFILMLGRVC